MVLARPGNGAGLACEAETLVGRRRKAGRHPGCPAYRSWGLLLCPSPLSERQTSPSAQGHSKVTPESPLDWFFPPGSAVSKLLISNSIRTLVMACGTGRSRADVGLRQFGRSPAQAGRRMAPTSAVAPASPARTYPPRFGWSGAKLSRIETGQARVKMEDLDRFLDLYQISDSHRAELAALAQESREVGPAGGTRRRRPPPVHFEIMDAESEAETAWNWEPQVVPGLLQSGELHSSCIAAMARCIRETGRRGRKNVL